MDTEILLEKNLMQSYDTKNINNMLADWLSELIIQRKYSEKTIDAYKRDVNNFLSFASNHYNNIITVGILRSMKVQDFRSWLSYRISHKKSARYNARAISSVKSFFNFLAKRNLVDLKAINSVRRPKLSALLPKPINEKIIFEFLNLPFFFDREQQWITNRDRALFTLLYCTGMRISEALGIKTMDVDLEMKILGKGKKDRIVILLPIAIERIKTYIASCPHDLRNGYLFVGIMGKKLHASYIGNRFEKLRILHNLPDHVSAHAFRHSFATHMVNNGADLRTVQELLGHESLSSTQIYTNVDDYSLLKIYEKTHPLEN